MTLRPMQHLGTPRYPRRRGGETSFGRWLRRSLAAALASGALVFAGCSGVAARDFDDEWTEETDLLTILEVLVEEPPVTTPDEEISPGGMPAPDHEYAFSCTGEMPWFTPSAPTTLDGYLCDELASVSTVNIVADGRYEVSLSQGAAFIVLIDPGGEEMAEIDPVTPRVELDMTAGQWRLSATPADPINEPYGYFSVDIVVVEH